MQKGHHLQFNCLSCEKPVNFSVFQLHEENHALHCSECNREYVIDDEVLCRHLKLFEDLCRQIVESEEILGNTTVGVDVKGETVKIPYKILLTRLNSSIDLVIGKTPISIRFRLEPSLDFPEHLQQ